MTRSLLTILALTAATAYAYVPQSSSFGGSHVVRAGSFNSRQSVGNVVVSESFGFDFAEDSYSNTPPALLGEANYKQWVSGVTGNSFLNRQYNLIGRVRELNLLQKTADAGILSKLEKNGVDLETLESFLPTLERLGALSFAANNQQLLINGVAPLVVEGAPLLLPLVAGALQTGPNAFYLGAALSAGAEFYLVANDVEVPLIGLPAGAILGLLLVPLAVISGGLGVALASVSKNK